MTKGNPNPFILFPLRILFSIIILFICTCNIVYAYIYSNQGEVMLQLLVLGTGPVDEEVICLIV
jgi:hypothetical protein